MAGAASVYVFLFSEKFRMRLVYRFRIEGAMTVSVTSVIRTVVGVSRNMTGSVGTICVMIFDSSRNSSLFRTKGEVSITVSVKSLVSSGMTTCIMLLVRG